jgi:hypothetical protein
VRPHTSARCQSRRRRPHVIPEPHSSSCGSICQGMRLRRTNKMPVRQARSEIRGRPPFGRRGAVGKNGSTRSHNGSGSSAAAIPVHATSPARIRFRRFCYLLLRKGDLIPNSFFERFVSPVFGTPHLNACRQSLHPPCPTREAAQLLTADIRRVQPLPFGNSLSPPVSLLCSFSRPLDYLHHRCR